MNRALAGVIAISISFAVIFRIFRYRSEEANAKIVLKESNQQKPVERPVTQSELSKANGVDGAPLFIALKDPFSSKIVVFDMKSGDNFYGPEGPYHLFAGRHATHGLAISSTDPSQVEGDLSNLTESQKDNHLQWHAKYTSKYPIVGYLVPDDYNHQDDVQSEVVTDTTENVDETKKDL